MRRLRRCLSEARSQKHKEQPRQAILLPPAFESGTADRRTKTVLFEYDGTAANRREVMRCAQMLRAFRGRRFGRRLYRGAGARHVRAERCGRAAGGGDPPGCAAADQPAAPLTRQPRGGEREGQFREGRGAAQPKGAAGIAQAFVQNQEGRRSVIHRIAQTISRREGPPVGCFFWGGAVTRPRRAPYSTDFSDSTMLIPLILRCESALMPTAKTVVISAA